MNAGYFSEWLSKYLEYLQLHHYSEKTIASYEQVLRQFGYYLFIMRTTGEKKPVREWMNKAHQRLDIDVMASPEEIELYLSFLVDSLSYREKTVYRIISTIQQYYRYIERQTNSASTLNPVSRVERPKIERTVSPFLSHEEVMRLLDGVDNARDQLIIHLIYATGVRVSELCAIAIEDISPTSQTIRIHGRSDKIRVIFIDNELLQTIMKYIGERTSGPLFLGHKNGQIAPRTIQHIFRQYAPPGITPHTLRHSYAKKLYHQTGDIHMVQKSLGYASPKAMPMYK
ncbi:MAG: tyrosine-type recombinase/integrase [Euryarchaeota archaeon]|nr:tyrosine-type recombinase/integrase [Euryarchaeota archaeon]